MAELPSSQGVSRAGKEWEKREYIMETSQWYHTRMKFSVYSWDGPVENPPQVGDMIELSFVVEAREAKGKWYNEVKACYIAKLTESSSDLKNK